MHRRSSEVVPEISLPPCIENRSPGSGITVVSGHVIEDGVSACHQVAYVYTKENRGLGPAVRLHTLEDRIPGSGFTVLRTGIQPAIRLHTKENRDLGPAIRLLTIENRVPGPAIRYRYLLPAH
jgi:hypothetical protein